MSSSNCSCRSHLSALSFSFFSYHSIEVVIPPYSELSIPVAYIYTHLQTFLLFFIFSLHFFFFVFVRLCVCFNMNIRLYSIVVASTVALCLCTQIVQQVAVHGAAIPVASDDRFVIMCDAGSSHTSLYIYTYKERESSSSTPPFSRPVTQTSWSKPSDTPLSDFGSNPSGAGPSLSVSCMILLIL
jgi:GDA1/CD39 (nucleoside phosphatase) family